MARVLVVHPASAAEDLARPRDDVLVQEGPDGDGGFVATEGPFREYRRWVDELDDGQLAERIEFRIAAPFWGLLFVLPFRRALGRPAGQRSAPWWAPPQRFDRRATDVLGLLLSVSIVAGYLGTLITQTLTYVGDEFHTGIGGQKNILSAVRASVVLLVPLAALADRLGRRRLITLCASLGCVATATAAVTPNLLGYGISQTVARGFGSALLVLITILSAEEMPAGSRAWAYSLIAMTQALGAGICVWFLPFADDSERAWRLLYLIPLLMLPLVLVVARNLPESRRFVAPHAAATISGHGRRFWLLATTGFLLALFAVPSSQLGNEFLRDARHFSAGRIALFTVVTVTPGAIGIIVGGRLADVRGRRQIGAIGVIGGALLSVATYSSSGSMMWIASTGSSIVAALVVPALGVYRPELFPTSLRGRVGGVIEAFQVAGAVVGLQLVGGLVDHGTSYGAAFGIAAIAPAIVAVLILTAYPETAQRSLEELNPEDSPEPVPRETGEVTRPARLLVAPLLLVGLLAGCGDDDGDDAIATTAPIVTEVHDPGTPPTSFNALKAIFEPLVEPLGLELTRAGVSDFESGPHLALYVVPTADTGGAQGYLDRVIPLIAALQPRLFEQFPNLASFDVCQEPVQPDGRANDFPLPVTLLLLNRDQFESVADWSTATLADLVAVVGTGSGAQLDVTPEIERLDDWRAAHPTT